MEINKIKDIEIYVSKQRVDIYSQDKLNLRFNNTFADPTKIQTLNTEYSFSFVLPITPNNQKIFDFADVTSKRSKFNKRYPTTVSADGLMIFDGELLIQSISREGYKCNLYINKLNTVESVFGESVLSEITGWTMAYEQDVTINDYNSKENIQYPQDVFFPLVSYGMFQKLPKADETYTSKFVIDDYNRVYNENLYPSLNLLRCVEKCFESKGYTVQGDIFDDEVLRKIYMSTSLGKEQDPTYNYGNPDMGKLEVNFNYDSWAEVEDRGGRGGKTYSQATSTVNNLDVQKFIITRSSEDGNWSKNNIYDIWSSKPFCTITNEDTVNKNLWRENRIVAPVDGYYKIGMEVDFNLDTTKTFNANWYTVTGRDETNLTAVEITPTVNFNNFFVEFQLVKNSTDGSEVKMIMPDYIDTVFSGLGTNNVTVINDAVNKYAAYPHTPKGKSSISTDDDPYSGGYLPQNGKMLNYDPSVNPNFVLGAAVAGPYKYGAVIKNGRSWDKTVAEENKSRALVHPYLGVTISPSRGNTGSGSSDGTGSRRNYNDRTSAVASPEYGVNTLEGGEIDWFVSNNSGRVKVKAIVHLKKNDMLQLKMVQRRWENANDTAEEEETRVESVGRGEYTTGSNTTATDTDNQTDAVVHVTNGKVTFECFSPDDISINNEYIKWNNPSRFPTDLQLSAFLSNEEKMSDFISNFLKEFNLSYSQTGKVITINKQKVDFNTKYSINLTDRVDEIETEAIEYPSQMSVEYSINEEERGFYTSAEKRATDEELQSNDWKEYADRGYDIIKITEDEYAEEEKTTIKTSFNWYEDFKVTMDGQNATVTIPVIAKDEWMIDGLKDAEFMKEDGLSFNRRYWFPSTLTDTKITLCNNPNRQVNIKLVSNSVEGCELSYREEGETLLSNFFNIFYDVDSNYIKFETYLTAEEYIQIKNGANIVVDDDVYIPIQLNGYDCSGNNKTVVTAMKK